MGATKFNQHKVLAMDAMRYLTIATATGDWYADPKGEFLAAKAACGVYRRFGSCGLTAEALPPPDHYLIGDISLHYRTGKHDQTQND